MTIEIHVPTLRTLGGATQAILDQMLGPGFHNIDPPEANAILVELMNVEGEEWAHRIPEALSSDELAAKMKADRTIVRARIELRLGFFLLFPGFVILCRPDDFEDFAGDAEMRKIIGRESLELAHAFDAPEFLVAGDVASDFLGTETTDWDGLREVLEEEEIPHEVIVLPPRPMR